jgi:nicotinamidase-related amidase
MSACLYLGVDLQEGFLSDEIRQSDYIENVEIYLDGLPYNDVVLTRFVNSQTSSFAKYLEWPKMQPGDKNTKFIGSLESKNFRITEKSTYSSWVGEVREMAAREGYDTIVLFGLDSDACVLKTGWTCLMPALGLSC